MIGDLVVAIAFLCATAAALVRGPHAALGWIFLPAALLVPRSIAIEIEGLPDLSVIRAALAGLIVGAVLRSGGREITPRWRPIDLLPVLATVSFAISYGLQTDLKGFLHRLAALTFEWLAPYVIGRASLRDARRTRQVLTPLVLAGAVLALLAVYECRMADRIAARLWHAVLGTHVPGFWLGGAAWRWGYLRAFGTLGHPIYLGAVFAGLAPIAILLGLLRRSPRHTTWATAALLAAGCLSALSRGPLVVLGGVSAFFPLLAARGRSLLLAAVLAGVFASPVALERFSDTLSATRLDLKDFGNTESARYRLALLLIYVDDIADVGWWGDPSVVGEEYEQAWSIDNAYLYLFITGGWCGGAIFVLLISLLYARGFRSIRALRGPRRQMLCATMAAFTGITGSMTNVWFAPDYATFFFLFAALLVDQTEPKWFPMRRVARSPARAPALPEVSRGDLAPA
jgi:hypothetical protein